jgi:hypothetical protein
MDKNATPIAQRLRILGALPHDVDKTSQFGCVVEKFTSAARRITEEAHGRKIDASEFRVALSQMINARLALETALSLGGRAPVDFANAPEFQRRLAIIDEKTRLHLTIPANPFFYSYMDFTTLEHETIQFIASVGSEIHTLLIEVFQLLKGTAIDFGRMVATVDILLVVTQTFISAAILGAAQQQQINADNNARQSAALLGTLNSVGATNGNSGGGGVDDDSSSTSPTDRRKKARRTASDFGAASAAAAAVVMAAQQPTPSPPTSK